MTVDLAAARASLEEHRARIRHEIEQQGVDPDSEDYRTDLERGFADGGRTAAERGQTITLVRELRAGLSDVERGLRKLDDGTYGLCERCGEPIGADRLEAIPWARLCITCKQAAR
ncbi:MAG: TraR/DksA family transcriptional regulator [Actinomycetota bacterium]